jgi:carbon monoxide dehydrogenase subunit G
MDRFTQAAAGAVVTLHIVGLTDDGKFTAMARFQHSVVINRPAERVFAFVSDFENDPPWSGVAQVRRSPVGPVGVGTTFRLRQQFLGRSLDIVMEVVRYEPDHVITVKTTSSRFVSMTGTRLVEPAGEATRLTFLGTGHTHGLLKPLEPLLAVAAGGHRLRVQLGRLKQCLESQP